METDYSKRELDSHFKELGDKIDFNTALTKELNTKVGIQNGRTAKLEGKANALSLATTVAAVLIGLIISLVVYSFKISQDNLKNQILLEISQMNK